MPSGSTYAELQAALRKTYYLTAESYRRKFRDARKRHDETFILFGERLERHLQSWVDMAEVEIKDLVLIEQLCSTVTPELVTRIKEQRPKTFKEAVQLAEVYADARRGKPPSRVFGGQDRSQDKFEDQQFKPTSQTTPPPDAPNASNSGNSDSGPRGGQPSSNSPTKLKCFYCGKVGHLRRDCKKLKYDNQHSKGNEGQNKNKVSGNCALVNHTGLPTFLSSVEGQTVKALRDTGASAVFVDEDVVPKNAPRGQDTVVTGITADFNTEAPTYLIHVDTPFYVGSLWAIAMNKLVAGLVIGNVIQPEQGEAIGLPVIQPGNTAAVVQTRAHKKATKRRPTRCTVSTVPLVGGPATEVEFKWHEYKTRRVKDKDKKRDRDKDTVPPACKKLRANFRQKFAPDCYRTREKDSSLWPTQAKKRYAKYFNQKARERWFEPGDEVLLLLPEKKNKLQIAWRGPYTIIERVGDWDYKIHVSGKDRLYHANLLKAYVRRKVGPDTDGEAVASAGVSPVVVDEEDPGTAPEFSPTVPLIRLQVPEGCGQPRSRLPESSSCPGLI